MAAKNLRIEKMSQQHLDAVLAIERTSNPAPWSENTFRAECTNPQAHYFVAILDGKVVGFAGYWAIVDEAHVTNVAVSAENRGKGIGKALMHKVLEDAADNGMTCSTLEVRAGNPAAILLYESLGYVRSGVRKGYYPNNSEDAIVMWLYGLEKVS